MHIHLAATATPREEAPASQWHCTQVHSLGLVCRLGVEAAQCIAYGSRRLGLALRRQSRLASVALHLPLHLCTTQHNTKQLSNSQTRYDLQHHFRRNYSIATLSIRRFGWNCSGRNCQSKYKELQFTAFWIDTLELDIGERLRASLGRNRANEALECTTRTKAQWQCECEPFVQWQLVFKETLARALR